MSRTMLECLWITPVSFPSRENLWILPLFMPTFETPTTKVAGFLGSSLYWAKLAKLCHQAIPAVPAVLIDLILDLIYSCLRSHLYRVKLPITSWPKMSRFWKTESRMLWIKSRSSLIAKETIFLWVVSP